jgi:uncharacterized protein with HEPN domain
MQHDDIAYLGHMRDNAEKVRELLTGRTRASFDADEVRQLAVTHLIQRIGEAAGRISAPYRQQHDEIPWKLIVGMRHRVVHDYLHVNLDVVWEAATHDVPALIAVLRRLLPDDPP